MVNRTGISVIDNTLGGGLPDGGLIVMTAAPDSQAEVLLTALADNRPTMYVTGLRPADEAREHLPDRTHVVHAAPEDILLESDRYLNRLTDVDQVILDPADGLERKDRDAYRDFLNKLKRRLNVTDGLGILSCIDSQDPPKLRNLTLKRADVVWRLEVKTKKDTIVTRLVVPKFRGGTPPEEPVKLRLGEEGVGIDTSREF